MSNRIHNLILLGLFLLVIFGANIASADVRGVYSPYNRPVVVRERDVEADNPVPAVLSISPSSAQLGSGAKTVTITGSGFVPNSVARWNGVARPSTFIDHSHLLVYLSANDMYGSSGRYINVWNPAPGGGYSNSAFFTINGYVAPGTGTSNAYSPASSTSKSSTSQNNADNSGNVEGAQDQNLGDSNLASSVILGGNSFMPSGLIQWLLLAIFILLIVIIIRKLLGKEDKYHSTPLKHA